MARIYIFGLSLQIFSPFNYSRLSGNTRMRPYDYCEIISTFDFGGGVTFPAMICR